VLEEVGEAGASLALVARADVVLDDDGVDRRGMILGNDHAQSVLETDVGELDLADRRGGHAQRSHEAD
jgi:hypothetical protein